MKKVYSNKYATTYFGHFMAIIRLIVTLKILKSYDQPDDGHELAQTCRRILIRIYFLHTTVVLLTTINIHNFYTHNGEDIP